MAKAQVPKAGHVVMVVEANHSYEKVIGNSSMPYLNSVAQKYALTLNYYSNTHPSIGNYFMLTTGKIITGNNGYAGTITSNNLARAALTAGVAWKSYFESLPGTGYVGGDVYPYVKYQNPFAYFSEIRNSGTEKNNIVPFTQFAADLSSGTLPQFSFVVPNLQHNMHDCPASAACRDADKAATADQWLKKNIDPLLANPEFQKDGLLVITWDEGNSDDTAHGGGRVATVVIGPSVKLNYKSQGFYQEQSLLRTVLAALGITDNLPGAAANAPLMSDLFVASTPVAETATAKAATTMSTAATAAITSCAPGATVPSVTICSPTATSGSPIHVTAAARASTTVNYMAVWLDGVKQYQTNASSVDTSIPAANGSHRVTVQAKDLKGNLFSQAVYTMVGASCTPGNTVPSVNICTPTSTSGSPIHVTAAAKASASVAYMAVWLDGVKQYQANANAIDTSIAAATGTHRLTVQAKDANGNLFSNTVNTTVGNPVQTWSISGTISPASLGAGVTVTLGGAKSATTTADANGNYSFSGLPNATYTITPSSSSVTFVPKSTTVTVSGANVASATFNAGSGTSGAHSVDLSWAASTSQVIGYKVYRASSSGGPYSLMTSAAITSTTYNDPTVAAGGKYYYVVTAVNSAGAESSYSNQVAATIPSP